jgi:3-dehydroquinate synthetase
VTNEKNLPELMKAVESDKKKGGDSINFILLKGIGESVIRNIKSEELMKYISGYSSFKNN